MPQIFGIQITVEVRDQDWQPLPEFKHESYQADGHLVVACWVPSKAEKAFRVNVQFPPIPRPSHWLFGLKLDGSEVVAKGNILKRESSKAGILIEEGYRSSASTSTFRFANLRLTDNEEALGRSSEGLGEIAVDLWSVASWNHVAYFDPAATRPSLEDQIVHERAKKASTHCISYGDQRAAGPSNGWSQPVGAKLQARVVFKYMSMDMLMAHGITQPDPTPSQQSTVTPNQLQGGSSAMRFKTEAGPHQSSVYPKQESLGSANPGPGWGDIKPRASGSGSFY